MQRIYPTTRLSPAKACRRLGMEPKTKVRSCVREVLGPMVRVLTAALLGVLATGTALAQTQNRVVHGTAYVSRWLNTDLTELPANAINGDLSLRSANFFAASAAVVVVRDFTLGFSGNRLELEGQLVKHFGQQDHLEGVISLVYRTPDIHVGGGFAVNFAFGEGMSYAFDTPAVEGLGKVEAHRWLNYLSFETEITHASLPGWSLVPRLHHRSGIFGLIAPKYAGSNYVGIGVRYDFR